MARRRNGQLLLTYFGGREGHVCPFGRVEMMRSDDEGRSWSEPIVLSEDGVSTDLGYPSTVELADGTLDRKSVV